MTLPLRPYQVEAIEAVGAAERRGVRRPLVAHATGLGKTVTFSHMISDRDDRRSLVLVHRDELVHQTVDKLGMVAPELKVGVVKAERDDVGAPVVVASVQTLARQNRLNRLEPDFGLVVCDEAHHVLKENTWGRVLDHIGALNGSGPLSVGFTATPERGDGKNLTVWQEVVHEMSVLRGIVEGYLVDITGMTVGTDLDLQDVSVHHGDFADGSLGEAIEGSNMLDDLADAYLRYAADRPALAYTPTVRTAAILADALTERGVAAEHVSGATPTDERRAILKRLRDGHTRVVANCAVLTEGFDEPSVSCIMIARPTQSHPLFMQMVGRGTRPHPGKEDLLVLDVAGASHHHDLRSVADIAGVDKIDEGKSVAQAALGTDDATKMSDRLAEIEASAAAQRARKTAKVDLMRSKMRWLPVGDGYCLPAGEETVIIVPDGGGWDVVTRNRSGFSVVYSGLTMDYAQGVGEDLARSAGKLAKRSAGWLSMPPTEAQINRLIREGLPAEKAARVSSRGQAADLITRIGARRVIRKLNRKEATE